jgi:hypothetical protein
MWWTIASGGTSHASVSIAELAKTRFTFRRTDVSTS